MTAVIIILIVLLAALCIVSWRMAGFSMGIRRQTLEEARAWQEARYDLSWYDAIEKEDYIVEGEDGYRLHAQRLIHPDGADRGVIISHGYTDNRFGALKYAKNYLDMGFDVIVYDLRGHGLNEPTFCTYSIRESRDLARLIADARTRCPQWRTLGLHGESLGAASTVACLKNCPDVDFAVSDCAFSDIRPVLRGGVRGMHLPAFLVDIASIAAKLRYGYSYAEMRPVEGLADNRVPILFLHGAEDTFILPSHSEILSKATSGYSELHLIPGAGHAGSALAVPELYRETVQAFVGKCKKMLDRNAE